MKINPAINQLNTSSCLLLLLELYTSCIEMKIQILSNKRLNVVGVYV